MAGVAELNKTARRNGPLTLLLAGTLAGIAGRRKLAGALSSFGIALFALRYLRLRRADHELTAEHVRRFRRLQIDVLPVVYDSFYTSMEEEIQSWPRYDQRKHALRYEVVTELVLDNVRQGGTVVDVGCSSALVLDRAGADRAIRAVGFDINEHGLRLRQQRASSPILAKAEVEHIPMMDGSADVVIFGEVIEHLVDPYAGLKEVSRITKEGGVVILTTNNASEMPTVSPLVNPGVWLERLAGRWWPTVLAFRNVTWNEPVDSSIDPLPPSTPTYVPHFHFSFSELRDLARDAGLELIDTGSFEFPAPQSGLAEWLRNLGRTHPAVADALGDGFETTMSKLPGVSSMGTHLLLVLRKRAEPLSRPSRGWWLTGLQTAEPA